MMMVVIMMVEMKVMMMPVVIMMMNSHLGRAIDPNSPMGIISQRINGSPSQ